MYYERLMEVTGLTKQAGMEKRALSSELIFNAIKGALAKGKFAQAQRMMNSVEARSLHPVLHRYPAIAKNKLNDVDVSKLTDPNIKNMVGQASELNHKLNNYMFGDRVLPAEQQALGDAMRFTKWPHVPADLIEAPKTLPQRNPFMPKILNDQLPASAYPELGNFPWAFRQSAGKRNMYDTANSLAERVLASKLP